MGNAPAFTMLMFRPRGMPWYKNTACIDSRSSFSPRKEKDRLLSPPLNETAGCICFSVPTAFKKSRPYALCSSSPVAIVRMLQSKMMSSAGNPTRLGSVKILKHRSQMRTLSSYVAAWPSSSNAITTTAQPYRRISRACRTNSSSPTFREIEFTTAFAAKHFRPSITTSNLLESSMNGTLRMSSSPMHKCKKRRIADLPSIRSASKLKSITVAPASTCSRQICSAAVHSPFDISRLNFKLPIRLHRSPTLMNWVASESGSVPASFISGFTRSFGSGRSSAADSGTITSWSWHSKLKQPDSPACRSQKVCRNAAETSASAAASEPEEEKPSITQHAAFSRRFSYCSAASVFNLPVLASIAAASSKEMPTHHGRKCCTDISHASNDIPETVTYSPSTFSILVVTISGNGARR
mmetsp:Transcript_2251/g.5322  ORF Transcript_2251/g.5322 Transcript_2251/m.5322 type:complete len:410 (+) Transcript_2251:2315-3544(+)